jgi:hypothetical protein
VAVMTTVPHVPGELCTKSLLSARRRGFAASLDDGLGS